MRCFPKGGEGNALSTPKLLLLSEDQGDALALSFSSLTRAVVFGMTKRAPNPRVVSSAGGRRCPVLSRSADAQSIFPGAHPSAVPALPPPEPVPLHAPCPPCGRGATLGLALAALQERAERTRLWSRSPPGKSLEQVGSGNVLGKDVAWGWCGCSFTACDPPGKDSTHPLKNGSTGGQI